MDKTLGKGVALDVQIASGMIAAGLLSQDGVKQIQQVLQGASDPAAAIGNAIFQAMSTVAVQLKNQNIEIDDKAWIAGGGVLDRVMYDVIGLLVGAFGFEQAATPEFVKDLRENITDLMQQDLERKQEGGDSGGEFAPPVPGAGATGGLLQAAGPPPQMPQPQVDPRTRGPSPMDSGGTPGGLING